jgi:hypothetical protein
MTWRLTFHPAAPKLPPFIFDQQREACQTCRHSISRVSRNRAAGSGLILRCSLINGPASLARLAGQACGPEALQREAL